MASAEYSLVFIRTVLTRRIQIFYNKAKMQKLNVKMEVQCSVGGRS